MIEYESIAGTKAAYRFFDRDNVEVKDIQESFFSSTLERIREEETVMVAQDTTSFDFSRHKQTKGLGYLDKVLCQGIKMHSGNLKLGRGRTRRLIIMADREADIFDLFAQVREEGYELLIRETWTKSPITEKQPSRFICI